MTEYYSRLRKYEGGLHGYVLSVDGRDVALSFKDLWNHRRLTKVIFAEHGRLIPRLTQRKWEDSYLIVLLETLEILPMPEGQQ